MANALIDYGALMQQADPYAYIRDYLAQNPLGNVQTGYTLMEGQGPEQIQNFSFGPGRAGFVQADGTYKVPVSTAAPWNGNGQQGYYVTADDQGNIIGDPQHWTQTGNNAFEDFLSKGGGPLLPLAMYGASTMMGGAGGVGSGAGSTAAATTPYDVFGAEAGISGATQSGGFYGGAAGTAGGAAGSVGSTSAATGGGLLGKEILGTGVTGGDLLDIAKVGAPIAAGVLAGVEANNAPKTNETTYDVPEWARPYGQDLAQRGQAIADTQFTPFDRTNQDIADATSSIRRTMDQFGPATEGAREYLRSVQAGERAYTPDRIERASNPYLGATTQGASNPYIGQTVGQIAGPQSVLNLAQQAQVNNPYIAQTSGQASLTNANQAGRNALLGLNNPYLQNAINLASQDVIQNYQTGIAPTRAAQEQASGSFGNATINQMRGIDEQNLARSLANVSSGMRMQDYGLQAQLGEGQAGREQATNLFNAGAANQTSQFNVGARAADLARQTGATNQLGALNAGNLLQAGMFDVNALQNQRQFNAGLAQTDLGRNAQLAGQQGQFNASLAQGDLARNANLAQNLSQFNSGVSAQDIGNQYNAWQGNNNLMMGSINPTLAIANNPIAQSQALVGVAQPQQAYDYQNWQAGQQWPMQTLNAYGNAYSQGVGRSGVSSTPAATPNPWATGIGTTIGMYSLLNPGSRY